MRPRLRELGALEGAIEAACRRTAPLWPLRSFVAVNPFLGLVDRPFREAMGDVERVLHARAFLPLAFYRRRYREGRITDDDLERALDAAPCLLARCELATADPDRLRRLLLEAERWPAPPPPVLTYAEALDRATGRRLAPLAVAEVGKWCAARFDAGQAAWRLPWSDLPLFGAWRETAALDRTPELHGLRGFRDYARGLPGEPRKALGAVLEQLRVPAAQTEAFLARQLASVAGWAGHVQHRVREAAMRGEEDDSLEHLLAIRAAWDGAIQLAMGEPAGLGDWAALQPPEPPPPGELLLELEARLLWQHAFEEAWRRPLRRRLVAGGTPQPSGRPPLQAVFCIDVRSEVLRRHLEATAPQVQTLGFAGFFGVPVEYVRLGAEVGAAHCPVLLSPAHVVREASDAGPASEARLARAQARHRTFKAWRLSTVSTFPFVETVGPLFGARMLADAARCTRPASDGRLLPDRPPDRLRPRLAPEERAGRRFGLALAERVDLAEGILRNTGLLDELAPVVLLCGHGSATANNPYASGLDCGACGGQTGEVSARIAAALLNDPAVRRELAHRGLAVPADTVFVAGLHETTTDRVRLLDAAGAPAETLERVRGWLAEAGRRARAERQERLGGAGSRPMRDEALVRREALRRSRDWSEVRPEWGLARNAAFVAAPRARTRGLDLDGRVFLHDYDTRKDPDGSILELILAAPLVVASWINLQYYASTVDNDVLGSGNKVLHNVVGRHGVMLGNRSDLRPGLPWQSVHDGRDYVHEPMRLLALVEAEPARVAAVLEAHPAVRELVDHEWLALEAIDPATGGIHRWERGAFRPVEAVEPGGGAAERLRDPGAAR